MCGNGKINNVRTLLVFFYQMLEIRPSFSIKLAKRTVDTELQQTSQSYG